VLEAIREMIYQGRLSPGQQLRQEELAIALGVSRNPVREALKGLQAERFVGHSLNQGYFVTRLADVRARPADAEGCTRPVRGRRRSANKEITP
jgi:DNA-binding GntR family transcriptional regulator